MKRRAAAHAGDSADVLGREELAEHAGVAPRRVDELTRAGVLHTQPDGGYSPGDVDRIRVAGAFESAGVPLDALARAVQEGTVSFAYYHELHAQASGASSRTFGELKATLGDGAPLMERLLTMFGLATPDDDGRLDADDERLLLEAVEAFAGIGKPELGLRVARLLGEGARRTSEAALDVYGLAADEVQRQAAGLPGDEIYERHLSPWSRVARLAPRLAAWLHARHLSAAIDAYSVDATERVLEETGLVPPRQESPPAVAFVDLTGFTRLAEEQGDQAAASMAMQLAAFADDAARGRDGRIVKLLGDGVLLRFGDAVGAVDASLQLLAALSAAGLPSGHVGVDAGRLVVREGDVFGRSVNLAARLSERAQPGEILVTEAVAAVLPDGRYLCEPRGPLDLKGIERPVRACAVSIATDGGR